MKKIIFNEDEIKDIIDMYTSFVSVTEICKKYNIALKRIIYDVLKSNEISLHGKKRKFSETESLKIIADYRDGKSSIEIASEMDTSSNVIINVLKRNNITIRLKGESLRKYSVNDFYFDEIDSYEKAYVCGLLWSDGCNKRDRNTISITLQETDKHILDTLTELMDSTYPIHFKDNSKKGYKNTYTFEVRSRHMSEQLEKLGMTANKSLILEFPKWLDKELYSSFLLGVLDGDGHISHHKGKYAVVYACSAKFCEYLANILSDMNIHYAIYDIGKTGLSKSLHIARKNDCITFLNWLYEKCPIYLHRKHNIYINNYNSSQVA